MNKKYKLKTDPEENCFMCSKSNTSFDKPSLELILTLPLCMHHTETIKIALAKLDRVPGEDDE